MYLLGHTDPKFTMRVCQHVLDMGGSAMEQLEHAFGCSCEDAFAVLTGRDVRGLIEDPGKKMAAPEGRPADLGDGKPRDSGAFQEAADGIRTHDLLHGKQTL
jgi:hypothetical protein